MSMPTTDAELVRRIRQGGGDRYPYDLAKMAANRVERLSTERAAMLAELKWIVEKHGYQSTADIIAKVEGAETH